MFGRRTAVQPYAVGVVLSAYMASSGCSEGCFAPGLLANLDGFDASRQALLDEANQMDCDEFRNLYAGECVGQNLVFLRTSTGFSFQVRYFNAQTGHFVAAAGGTDAGDPFCVGRGFAPFRVECDNPIVTEVICGTNLQPGDDIFLP